MTLEELKQESYKDLPVKNVENIDQESFYNQAATDVEYLTASIDFAYQIYEIEAIS